MSHVNLQEKAKLLQLVLSKHNPNQIKDLAFKLLQKARPGSDEYKCFAALYELTDIFTTK